MIHKLYVMKTAIIITILCLSGRVLASTVVKTCTIECKTQEYLANSSYMFDLFFTNKTKLDASIIHARDNKIFMVFNYQHGISAAFHIDTPIITWANVTSNNVVLFDYKRQMALLVTDTSYLQGVQRNLVIDIDLLLVRLSKLVQEKSNLENGAEVFNTTYVANEFLRRNYDLQSIFKYNLDLAKKLEETFGLWFELCQFWIENGYIKPELGFVGFSSVVFGFYQKSTDAMMILLGYAYSVDAMSTCLVEGIEKVFANQADAYYVSMRQLIARLKMYPSAQKAVDSLFEDEPLEINKQIKSIKLAKFSFIVIKSTNYGYMIIMQNLSNVFGGICIMYHKLEGSITINNYALKISITINPELHKFAIYNYSTDYGLIIDYNNYNTVPFSNALASKYFELSFQFRAGAEINRNITLSNQNQAISTINFEAFLRNLSQSRTIDKCQSVLPKDVMFDLKAKLGGYFNLVYSNSSFFSSFDIMVPSLVINGVNLSSCILPLVKRITTAGANINKIADKFLTFVKLNVLKIFTNVTLNIDSFLEIKAGI